MLILVLFAMAWSAQVEYGLPDETVLDGLVRERYVVLAAQRQYDVRSLGQ